MMQITLASAGEVRRDAVLARQIAAIVDPNYDDCSALLARELAHGTHVYLAHAGDELVSFFMVAYEHLTLGPPYSANLPALYLGLSAALHSAAGVNGVMQLYGQAISDAVHWEGTHGCKLFIWSTTASPMIYTVMKRYLADVEPKENGDFSAAGEAAARAIEHLIGSHASAHPFVLPGYATATRYSEMERARLDQTARAKRFSLFEHLAINEQAGDRLLVLAHTPSYVPGFAKGRYARLLPVDVR
jgi:hypothetical protein